MIDTLEKRCFSRRGMGCRAKIACGDFLSILQSARTACVVQSAPLENKMLVFKCADYKAVEAIIKV